MGLVALAASLAVAEKPSRTAPAEAVALIGVTVFREPGFAVAGAAVQLTPAPPEKPASKPKAMKAATGARGEFVFRVPPVAMQYTVAVSAKGLKSQQKPVSVRGEERVDVTFMLGPESK